MLEDPRPDRRGYVQPVLACADPRFSYRAEDVVATLERACATTGYPKTIRVDQGSEFVSRDLDLWAYTRGVTLDFSRPGKPTDNAFIEAFNGRLRAECLNAHWFLTLADARKKLEDWRKDYNEVRPHGAIGNQPPVSLHVSRRRTQPADGIKPGKLYLPAVQSSGADQANHQLTFALDQSLGADHDKPRLPSSLRATPYRIGCLRNIAGSVFDAGDQMDLVLFVDLLFVFHDVDNRLQ